VALMQVERWRERILAERDRAIDELLVAHPDADRQRLRQLAMAAEREQREGRSPRAARQLFAALREVFGV
jgi:ribosome-associated protein